MTRLKYERRQRRQSQHALAKDVGMNQPVVSEIERGIRIPTPRQLERLAAAFPDIRPADLLKEVIILPWVAAR